MGRLLWEWEKYRFWILGVFVAFSFWSGGLKAQAAQVGTEGKLNFADTVGSTDDIAGGTITPTLIYVEEEDVLRLRFQTTGYPERYYTATAFKNVSMDLEGYQGVEFHVLNHLKTPVRMNFAFSAANGRTAAAGNGYYVRLKGEESDYAKVEYGCFELPGYFDGTVEIPFDVLKYQETSADASDLNSIWGYGIICVVQENERYDIELSGLRLLTPQEATGAETPGAIMIVGEDRALRSSYGENQTTYHCEVFNMLGESEETEAEFFLVKVGEEEISSGKTKEEMGERTEAEREGEERTDEEMEEERVWISKDGVLTVDYRCDAQVLEIGARTAEGRTAYKQVELYESWTNITSTENGYNASIARPSQISPIVSNADVFENPKVLWRIREILTAAAVIFMLWYLRARRKSRRR